MRAVAKTLTLLGAALGMAMLPAHGMGFGRVANATQLGQALNFAAVIRLDADETLTRECVAAEVLVGENKVPTSQVRVTLEGAADAIERSVRVTTTALIDEPVVTVSVTLGCNAKVTRRFVAFIDPPLLNAAQTLPPELATPQRADTQVAPLVSIVQGESGAATKPASRSPQARSRARSPASVAPSRASVAGSSLAEAGPDDAASAPARGRRKAAASRAPLVARAAPAGSRLQLEAPVVIAAAPVPAAASGAAAGFASAPVDETSAQLARERERIQLLEEGLARLRSDSQETQKALAAVRLQLKDAEAARFANPLVYALAWLSALLALAVAALLWRQSRARGVAQWWLAPQAPAPTLESKRAAEQALLRAELEEPPTNAYSFELAPDIQDSMPASLATTSMTGMTVPAHFSTDAQASAEPARELSVEELIDLEQQAEFFIVLGQDDAAIDLLMSHVRSDGGISPLPYLKLLEIYRRLGDSESYQRIRERFNRRFNAYAPDWGADLQRGRSLADYPEIIVRLQSLWASPVRAMETLDASVFRRNQSDETFDLPAYRELLFLYSIARDLAEHGASVAGEEVDFLLPLSGAGEEPIERLSATTRTGDFVNSDMMTMPLDLDVSFNPEVTAVQPHKAPAASRVLAPSAAPKPIDSGFIDLDDMAPPDPERATRH